jgi:hypothetical protein
LHFAPGPGVALNSQQGGSSARTLNATTSSRRARGMGPSRQALVRQASNGKPAYVLPTKFRDGARLGGRPNSEMGLVWEDASCNIRARAHQDGSDLGEWRGCQASTLGTRPTWTMLEPITAWLVLERRGDKR